MYWVYNLPNGIFELLTIGFLLPSVWQACFPPGNGYAVSMSSVPITISSAFTWLE